MNKINCCHLEGNEPSEEEHKDICCHEHQVMGVDPHAVLKALRATGLPHEEPPNWQHASLIWALESFARHSSSCAAIQNVDNPCTCQYEPWLRDIAERWAEETTPTEEFVLPHPLRRYASHLPDCAVSKLPPDSDDLIGGPDECTCGLLAAVEATPPVVVRQDRSAQAQVEEGGDDA